MYLYSIFLKLLFISEIMDELPGGASSNILLNRNRAPAEIISSSSVEPKLEPDFHQLDTKPKSKKNMHKKMYKMFYNESY
jgi:hypothetical protein